MEKTKKSAIKIFYLTTDTKIGGTERMLLALLNGLDRNKYCPFVCAIKPWGPLIEEAEKIGVRGECLIRSIKCQVSSVRVSPIKKLSEKATLFIGLILAPFKLAVLLKREKPDILHTFLFHANILGRIIGRWAGVPVIISSQRSVDKWRKPWHSLIDRWTSKFCNLIISNSEAGRKILIEREKIDPKKIITIHNGIDISKFDKGINIAEKKKEFGIGPDDILIGIIANLREVKGHRYLFEAVANICSGRAMTKQSLKVLVVGEGKLKQELINLVERLGIKDNVIFSGFRNDIPTILKIIDIFVLPSLWEGFPVSILEAMASVRPVIASRVGGVPEAVIDGETGLLVPSEDAQSLGRAITRLVNEPEKAKKMGEAGRKRVEEYFNVDKMIEKIEGVYYEFRKSF